MKNVYHICKFYFMWIITYINKGWNKGLNSISVEIYELSIANFLSFLKKYTNNIYLSITNFTFFTTNYGTPFRQNIFRVAFSNCGVFARRRDQRWTICVAHRWRWALWKRWSTTTTRSFQLRSGPSTTCPFCRLSTKIPWSLAAPSYSTTR